MDRKMILNIINDLLKPLKFKRVGTKWMLREEEITKIVSLHKSSFGNRYYIDYGFIINKLPLGNITMHVSFGLGSTNFQENEKIKELLFLDSPIKDQERKTELSKLINKNLIYKLQKINTESDLISALKEKQNLNDIPLIVKKYFKMT